MTQSDMYASKWRYASIQNFVFIKNVSRHMFFNATKYQCCYILDNNYYDNRFIATNFTKCTIMDCLLLHSTIRGTVFSEGKMQHVRFDKSTLKRCRFSQCNMICDSFWNGCRILNCKYEQMQMTHNVIKGTNFVAVCFMDVKFWPTEFVGAFRKCQFINVKWGGSRLSGVQFIGCILENVDFAGAIGLVIYVYGRRIICLLWSLLKERDRQRQLLFQADCGRYYGYGGIGDISAGELAE